MNIDHRALQDGSPVAGNNNDSPTYGIHSRTVGSSTSTRSEVSCCEKNNPPSSTVVDIDEGSKSSDDFENEYDGIQNVKTTSSDIVGGCEAVKKQDDTSTLRFIEKNNKDITGEKTMNCEQPTEKQLGASTSEILGNNTKCLEKAVPPAVCRLKIKVWATVVASGAMDLKNYKKWLKTIESETKNTRATTGSDVAVVLRSVLNIPQKVTSTTIKEKPDP